MKLRTMVALAKRYGSEVEFRSSTGPTFTGLFLVNGSAVMALFPGSPTSAAEAVSDFGEENSQGVWASFKGVEKTSESISAVVKIAAGGNPPDPAFVRGAVERWGVGALLEGPVVIEGLAPPESAAAEDGAEFLATRVSQLESELEQEKQARLAERSNGDAAREELRTLQDQIREAERDTSDSIHLAVPVGQFAEFVLLIRRGLTVRDPGMIGIRPGAAEVARMLYAQQPSRFGPVFGGVVDLTAKS